MKTRKTSAKTSGPNRLLRAGSWTIRARTSSQAPQAVRSARGRRLDRASSSAPATGGAFHADERDSFRLTVDVHRFRDKSTAATVRAVVRVHSSPPSSVTVIFHETPAEFSANVFVLRIANRGGRGKHEGRFRSKCLRQRRLTDTDNDAW